MEGISFRKNVSWTFASNLIYAFSNFIILILLIKLTDIETVGMYTLALAITAPISLLFEMKMNYLFVTSTSEDDFFNYLWARFLTIVLFIIITIIIGVYFYSANLMLIILFVAMLKSFDVWMKMIYSLYQMKERMDYISRAKITKSIIMIISFSVSLYITRSLIFALSVTVSVLLVLIIISTLRILKLIRNKKKIEMSLLLYIIKKSFPLGIVAAFISINTNIPRYFIEFEFGAELLGIFGAISYFVVAGNMFINSVAQVAIRRLYTLYQVNLKEYLTLLTKLSVYAFTVGIVLVFFIYLFGDQILVIIFNDSFIGYTDIFILIMIATTFNFVGWFFETGITSAGRIKVQPFIALFTVITSLILSYFLIPIYGLYGASLVLIVSSLVQVLLKFIVIKDIINKKKKSMSRETEVI